jgi:hypothetical protein
MARCLIQQGDTFTPLAAYTPLVAYKPLLQKPFITLDGGCKILKICYSNTYSNFKNMIRGSRHRESNPNVRKQKRQLNVHLTRYLSQRNRFSSSKSVWTTYYKCDFSSGGDELFHAEKQTERHDEVFL